MTTSTVTDLSGSSGYVRVQWSGLSKPANWVAYRVYFREDNPEGDWQLAYETTTDTTTYDYHLWQFMVGIAQDISVIEVTRDGRYAPVEGAHDSITTVTPTGDNNYWVIDPFVEANNFVLYHVTKDTIDEEVEQAVIPIIGRGRKVDRGEVIGRTINLELALFDNDTKTARQQRHDIEVMSTSAQHYFLRTPFGDTYKVAVEAHPTFERQAGVGTAHMYRTSLTLMEVV